MSRPKKQTVDYFPHDCQHKGTMFILEEKFGNDGYSFWFKLLEMLGISEGHFIDCRNPHQWLFLIAKTRLFEDKCTEILNLLSDLDAIDRELWKIKVIWSENFVERISEAYRNRVLDIPSYPAFLLNKPTSKEVSDVRNPQSKRKETKLKETKEDIYTLFISQLKENPAYKGIDIDRELSKMDAWFLTPKGKGRKKTKGFIVNWLNKCDAEIGGNNGSTKEFNTNTKGQSDFSEFRK